MKRILLAILALSIVSICYAEDGTEEIVLTTYYPAPYGEYEELQSDKLAVGSNAAMPTDNGVLQFEKLTTTDGTIPAYTAAKEGTIYYNADATEKKFKFNDGSGWQDLGGGGGGNNIIFTSVAGTYSTSSTTWVDIPDVSITESFPGGNVFILFEGHFSVSAPTVATNGYVRLLIDGTEYDSSWCRGEFYVFGGTIVLSWAGNLDAGNHTIKAQARVTAADSALIATDTPRLTVIK